MRVFDLMARIGVNLAEFSADMGAAEQRAQRGSTVIGRALTTVGNVGRVAFGAAAGAAAAATTAIGGLTVAGVKNAAQMEQTAVAYRVLTGDADKAAETLRRLEELGAETPFEFPELAEAGRMLLAFGFAAEEIPDVLRKIGDVAAGTNTPIGDMAYLFGTARTQGQLFAQDINQFTGRGVPIIRELAKVLGVAENEVKQLVSEGKVGFPELMAALDGLSGAGGQFFGLMQAQSETLSGMWSNLQDWFGVLTRGLGERFMPVLKEAMQWLLDNTDRITNLIQRGYDVISAVVSFVMDLMGRFREALNEVLLDGGNMADGLQGSFEKVQEYGRIAFEFLVTLWERVLKPTWEAISPFVVGVWRGIRDAIGPIIDAIFRILQALTHFLNGEFAEGWADMRDAVYAISGALSNFVVSAFEGLIESLRNILPKFVEFGRNLVQGLVDGIRGMWDDAKQAVTGLGENVVSWFREKLGIRSPSRVFYEFGRNIVEGLADGIRELQTEGEEAVAELAALVTRRALEALGLNVRPNQWETMGAAIAQGILDGFDAVIPGFADRLAAAAAAGKGMAAQLALERHVASGGPLRVPEPELGGVTPAGPFVPDPIGIEGRRARPSVNLALVWTFVETLVGGVREGVEVARDATLDFLANVEAYRRELDRREREAARERRMARERHRDALELRYGTYGDQFTSRALNDPRNPPRPAPPERIVPGLREPGAELPELAPIVPDLLPPPAEPELIVRPSTERAEDEREAAIRAEIQARRESVDALLSMSTEKGALGNFGASLLALAVDKVPLLGSAIDGFVQGGPMGALVAVFTDLLSRSEAFGAVMEYLSGFVQRLADALGTLLDALWPIIEVALQMVEVALAPLVWLLTNVVAPVFRFVARIVAGIWNAIASAINWALGWLGVNLPTIDPEGGVPRSGDTGGGSGRPVDGSTSRTGGRQVSEITGPTRDLLVSLLTPLSALPSMTGYLASIRDILDARLMPAPALAGAGAGGVVFHPGAIVIHASGADANSLLDDLETALARRLGNRWRSH